MNLSRQDLMVWVRSFTRTKKFWFFLILFLIYKSIFNIFTGRLIIQKGFESSSTGKISLWVSRFSLFYGFEFKDIKIHSGEDFQGAELFRADRIALKYNLPALFWGRLKLSEIGLENPYITLIQKNGAWNVEKLFPPSAKKEEAKKEEEVKKEGSSEEISTYVPVSAYLKFFITNLGISIEKEKGKGFFAGKIEPFTFSLEIDTNRFRKIPLNQNAVNLLDTFDIRMNPEKKVRIYFEDNDKKIDSPFSLMLSLIKSGSGKNLILDSSMDLSAEAVQLIIKGKKNLDFGFSFGYKLQYLPTSDTAILDSLRFAFNKDIWLDGSGKVESASQNNRDIQISIQNSSIRLAPIAEVMNSLPGMTPMGLNGHIELAPLRVSGKMDSLDIGGEFKIRDFLFSSGGSKHKINSLAFAFQTILDLATEAKPTAGKPVPMLKIFRIGKLDLDYNNALFGISGEFSPGTNIGLNINYKKLSLPQYAPGQYGESSGTIQLNGREFSRMVLDTKIQVYGYRFSAGKSVSGPSNLEVILQGPLLFAEKFQLTDIGMEKLVFNMKNQSGGKALGLSMAGNMNMKNGFSISGQKLDMMTDFTNMLPTLTLSLKDTIAPMRESYGNVLTYKGSFFYGLTKEGQDIRGNLTMTLPAYEMKDLNLDFDTKLLKDVKATIQIPKLRFSAYNGLLSGSVTGKMEKGTPGAPAPMGDYFPDMDISLKLSSEKEEYMMKGISLSGFFGADMKMKDFLITGKLGAKKMKLFMKTGKCPGEACKLFLVDQIFLDFPFTHDLSIKKTANLLEGDKSRFIKTYGQTKPSNFTIDQVLGPHPYIKGAPFEYVKKTGGRPGFSARMDYTENVFTLDQMKIFTLDGVIAGKDVLFNLGGGKSEDMEYSMVLQVKDIDLKQLLPAASRDKIDDGKVKADMNISGRNLSDPIANLNLFFSVYKIGRDFGVSAVNVISPQNFITDYIVRSYNVNKMEIDLSKGLVYATIQFDKTFLSSLLVSLENDTIKQERMPLANFLKRARSEVSRYEK